MNNNKWKVCISASLFFYYEYFQINMFNVLDQHIMREFSVGAYEIGIISSSYFYAIVLSLLPAGIILDFISTRKIILCSMVVAIAGTLWFASAQNIHQLIYARLFVGLGGSAFCLLSSIKLATRWFPAKQLGLVIGVVIAIGMLGGVMAQTPFAIAISYLGWRGAIVLDAVIGVV
ncbi:MAG: MFS transporter, partial [Myxococcaceae bacterium]